MGNNVVEAGLIDRVIKFWCGGYVEIFFQDAITLRLEEYGERRCTTVGQSVTPVTAGDPVMAR